MLDPLKDGEKELEAPQEGKSYKNRRSQVCLWLRPSATWFLEMVASSWLMSKRNQEQPSLR